MENLIKTNIISIFGILILFIITISIIVKLHEWLLKTAISGLLLIFALVIYSQYSGLNLIDWQGMKKQAISYLGIGQKVERRINSLSGELEKKIDIEKLEGPLMRIKENVGKGIIQGQKGLKSLEKEWNKSEKQNSQKDGDPSTRFTFKKKKTGLLEF